MTVINTNTNATRAANASSSAQQMLGNAMERLSTGKRINSAKDDAAGMAISTSMTAQISGMSQGIRNANDGISLSQTAEGALTEVTTMLQRVRELSVQSASGTYQNADRTNMQQEVTSLTTQIGAVLSNTKFNGNVLFSTTAGTNLTFTIQAGANSSDTITLTSNAIDGTKINAAALDVTTAAKATTTMGNVDTALAQVSASAAGFGAGESQLGSAVNNLTNTQISLQALVERDY